MVGSRLNVHLYRDSFNTPWGFRLQGGKDLSQPLVVQRVFSNSPAEGELQRGDVILSINSRDASQLTHKQAQDLIKHGGGQVQLVVNRPPPGTQVPPLSPPIVTQRPRAPSLQSPSSATPSSRPLTIILATSQGAEAQHKPPAMQPLHVQTPASTQHQVQRQRSSYSQPPSTPTPSTPVPPWAAQQFEPKRVSKLSKLGGGGQSFGTDYCTLPRRSSSAQYGGRYHTQSQSSDGPDAGEPDRLATGPPPRVCNLRNLGGGGFDFGTSFGSGSATLPRRNAGRRLSQPPSMPGTTGYTPKKVNLNRLGGGGPEFGSDFSHRDGFAQTAAQRYEPSNDKSAMLNRVHTSLDTITLSPRTPEVQATSPFYQAYEPQQQPQYQSPPQQVFTPTGLLLEQQRLQEQQDEGEAIVPVWERRRQFQPGPSQSAVRTPANKPAPRIPKPRPGPTTYGDFGTDYSRQKPSTGSWRPAQPSKPTQAPVFKPTPAPVSAAPATYSPAVQFAPKPAPKPSPPLPSYAPGPAPQQSWQQPPPQEDESTPAWRNTLKSTGVKPWEQDTGYTIPQPPVSSKPPPPATNESGERDWSQSAVLRFISQEESRSKPKQPPAVSPKPKVYSPGQPQQQESYFDEVGASDF